MIASGESDIEVVSPETHVLGTTLSSFVSSRSLRNVTTNTDSGTNELPWTLADLDSSNPYNNPILSTSPSVCSVLSSEEELSISSSPSSLASSFIAYKKKIIQPRKSILKKLPLCILNHILQYVDQFDLVNLLLTSSTLYNIAMDRLYKRVTVMLNAEFPLNCKKSSKRYILENGMKYMDTAMILTVSNLFKFFITLQTNAKHIQRVKFFVFDKCYTHDAVDISLVQCKIIDFFGAYSNEMNFLHITFIDFLTGITKLTNFLRNDNIRTKIFKLFVTSTEDLYKPNVPQSLTNLFLMLSEVELYSIEDWIGLDLVIDSKTALDVISHQQLNPIFDMSTYPYNVFNSLFTLTCSTNNQIGLEILKNIKLFSEDVKLKLKGLTVFHCHKETFSDEDNDLFNDHNDKFNNELYHRFMEALEKRLSFQVIESKVDIMHLSHLYLKIDCIEHRNHDCNCFDQFYRDFSEYLTQHDGLPNLVNFEAESFPNLEWLRPHQILENILTPLGVFIKTLSNLAQLTLDLLTPGFKMFDINIRMPTALLNKLNERLMEAFFLCFFALSDHQTVNNLRTLQLPDFLTSFVYYKPDFYESLLHTCQCWGCNLVLEKLKEQFHPIKLDNEDESDIESTYYNLFGYILSKLQMDREVCIPIKEKTFKYSQYPIYKGQPHTLHNVFHEKENHTACKCNIAQDPLCEDEKAIENLAVTYIIHQLLPIVKYLSMIFYKLDTIMIHGIYYEFNKKQQKMVPIFDDPEYPVQFLEERKAEIERGDIPSVPFGYFKT